MKKIVLSNADYQRIPAISSHGLIACLHSPADCWRKYLDPHRTDSEPTDALRMGSLVHGLALTPSQFPQEFRLVETRRTRDGKTEWQWTLSQGRIPIRPVELEKARAIVAALHANPDARKLLLYGKNERTIIQPRASGLLPLKARLDVHHETRRQIVELKTIRDLGLVKQALQRYQYALSAAFYQDLVRGQSVVMVFVQSTPPHEVAVFTLSRQHLLEGREQYHSALSRFDECWRSGVWPEAEPLPDFDDDPLLMPTMPNPPQRQAEVGELVL